ncbi:MAG TPA: hypothetical protein PK777_07560 [Thermoguttaceae bacterium]|nr:hypothetical protein [Thermoguttaceae bacterium]
MEGFLRDISKAFLSCGRENLHHIVGETIPPSGEGADPPSGDSPLEKAPFPPDQVKQVGDFLARQGLRMDRLDRFLVGWIDAPESMFQRLLQQGFSEQQIRQSRLLADRRLAGRLVGPIQTASREIVSLWARSISRSSDTASYLYWRPDWKTNVPVVWLPTALAHGGRKKGLLVVEDILEALMLQMQAFWRTVALGESGQPITPKRLAQFAQLRISGLIFVLNQTPDALQRLQKLREAFERGPWTFRLWFLPPQELGPYFSPGQLVREEGAEAFRDLLARKAIAVEKCIPADPIPPSFGKICPLHHCLETECFCFD